MEMRMKNFLILGLALVTIQTAFADLNGPGRGPRDPGRNDDSRALTQCLRDLSDSRSDLDQCRRNGVDQREAEGLRRENSNLRDLTSRLQRENSDLRFQLEQTRPSRVDVFSYAACTDYTGAIDLKAIGSGIGMNGLEAESNALSNVMKDKRCSFSAKVVKSEPIYSSQPNSYCAAACTDYTGALDTRTQVGGKGRNQTEAAFEALKLVQSTKRCSFAAKIVSCQ